MGIWNGIFTLAIAAACTVATSAVVIYTSRYLIADHHKTVLRNQFKQQARRIKQTLKSIEEEYQGITTILDNEKIPNTVPPMLVESDQESEHSDVTLDAKKSLEIEENLMRMLLRLDALHPRQVLKDVSTLHYYDALDTSAKDLMKQQVDHLHNQKKALIMKIQKSQARLDTLLIR
ncbi:hypothetical protein HDV01_003335 [Terramyces sp. JEL0728]|nr:hypothetical protein HDV01_003335 [Terramyces sp. JEL0728]